jgi:hypothetical protein
MQPDERFEQYGADRMFELLELSGLELIDAPRCSGTRLQKGAVLLARGDRGGRLFNDTHRRQHGPRTKTHPLDTDAGEIRDFRNTSRHHDVDRQRRELNEFFDQGEAVRPGTKIPLAPASA